jgi:hypothetical protein
MPIQINEIIIRATVGDKPGGERKKSLIDPAEKEAIIAECIDQVLEILEEKMER